MKTLKKLRVLEIDGGIKTFFKVHEKNNCKVHMRENNLLLVLKKLLFGSRVGWYLKNRLKLANLVQD
jgi:hypothetical protein